MAKSLTLDKFTVNFRSAVHWWHVSAGNCCLQYTYSSSNTLWSFLSQNDWALAVTQGDKWYFSGSDPRAGLKSKNNIQISQITNVQESNCCQSMHLLLSRGMNQNIRSSSAKSSQHFQVAVVADSRLGTLRKICWSDCQVRISFGMLRMCSFWCE